MATKSKTSEIKTSGKVRVFSSGSVRDDDSNKPRTSLIPHDLMRKRVAKHFTEGAKHYGDNNWRMGQAISETFDSLTRHVADYYEGKKDEDHLSAIVFNALSIMNVEEYYADDPSLNDMNWFTDGKPNGTGSHRHKK